uniref:Uncharacterized protein n=1 Tax=Oryza punctata TaxID=4537 RepID=A0A0E0LU28_ORYPU
MDQNKAKASGLRTNCNLSMGGDRQCEVYEHQKNDQQRTSVPAYGALVKPVATPDSWDNTQKPKFPFNSSASQALQIHRQIQHVGKIEVI